MDIGKLDKKFKDSLTSDNVKIVFNAIKRSKTDVVPRYRVKESIDSFGKMVKHKVLLDPI